VIERTSDCSLLSTSYIFTSVSRVEEMMPFDEHVSSFRVFDLCLTGLESICSNDVGLLDFLDLLFAIMSPLGVHSCSRLVRGM
jgi:hypothetical protein